MEITPASIHNETTIKQLLQSCDLPFEDISPAHLEHFFIVQNGTQINGIIGLEGCGEFGLLRSLAVTPSLRGYGLGYHLVKHIDIRDTELSPVHIKSPVNVTV